MGRLENFSQRRRNCELRKRNSIVVIGCEGKTEKTYFNNFNSRKCNVKLCYTTNTNPVGIVEKLVKFINNDIEKEEGDKYYAVFDTDVNQNKQGEIDQAKKLADENGVEIITSTPTFEFWYLLHFDYTTKVYNSSGEVVKELKNKISGYKKGTDTYCVLRGLTKKAITNAKKVEKYQMELGQTLDNENCNPYTGVYKVVEELIKRNEL